MRKNNTFALYLLALLLGVQFAVAQIAVYNFNDNTDATSSVTASTINANATASVFAVSDGSFTDLASTTGSPPDGFSIREAGSWNAVSATKFFNFTVDAKSSFELNVSGLTFEYRMTSSTGPTSYQIDIGSSTNVASGSFITDGSWHTISTSITLTGLTDPTEVKIYGYGASSSSSSFNIDTVTLLGTISAVPEPSTYATLAGVALLGFAGSRRRRSGNAALVAA